jgi:hypothetical protein
MGNTPQKICRTGGEGIMTREETIGALQSIIEEDKNAILVRVHVGFLIHAVKYLKEDQGIVRCKDCKYRTKRTCNNIELWECNHIRYELAKCGVTDDWFCADGERRDNDG